MARLRVPLLLVVSVAVSVAAVLPLGEPPEETVDEAVPAAATPAPVIAFVPEAMEIPKIGVSAPTATVWTEPDGKMGSPTNGVDVGWWGGRRPGEGNALFAAHVDWNGAAGTFYNLKDLEPGDEVVVHGEGYTHTYLVEWVRVFDRGIDAADILGNQSGAQVATLITCEGPFDRSIGGRHERLVVRAVLVGDDEGLPAATASVSV